MPKIHYENAGEVLKHEFLRGVIKTVDSETDTCTVEVSGNTVDALLFYHCEPESAIRDNGAIEGAAAGFAEEDAVIVQTNRDDPTEYLVVAHLDGVRSCGGYIVYTVSVSGGASKVHRMERKQSYRLNVGVRANNTSDCV